MNKVFSTSPSVQFRRFLSFAANLPVSSYFDLLISPTFLFLTCSYMYLLNSARLRELLYLLQRRLRFLISFFISLVKHGGSDCTILTIVFGVCFVFAKNFNCYIFSIYINAVFFNVSKLVSTISSENVKYFQNHMVSCVCFLQRCYFCGNLERNIPDNGTVHFVKERGTDHVCMLLLLGIKTKSMVNVEISVK